jgi:predicted GNAT superfamily acetyltransferase
VRSLVDMDDMTRAADLLAEIWGYPPGQLPMTPELLRALAHAGNYVAGAFASDALVGASAGFFGRHGGQDHGGRDVFLHSHITGVAPELQGRDIGYQLKQHQRRWALERGVDVVEWTFDPLIRRNAYFNLARLGAKVVAYERNLYGSMRDAMNAGEETDRAVVRWDLRAPATGAPDGSTATVILAADDDGAPVPSSSDAPVLRAWIPEDYGRDRVALKGWRLAVRDTVGTALGRGYVAVHMTRDGWYTLVRA